MIHMVFCLSADACMNHPVSLFLPHFARTRQVAWEKLEQWNSDYDSWVTMWELDVPLAMKFERPGETVSWFSELSSKSFVKFSIDLDMDPTSKSLIE